MNVDKEVKHKISNIYLIVEDIKKFPQTYSTILRQPISNCTEGTILRRKLNRLLKEGFIQRTTIPGTRFGKAIFYHDEKDYYLLFVADRIEGSKSYCFFSFEKDGRYYMNVKDYWELTNDVWIPGHNIRFFEGNVLKFM